MSGLFAKKWTPEQKLALIKATVDDGMTAPAARKAAQEGRFPGLRAFDPPLSTVRELAKLERRRRTGKNLSPLARSEPDYARRALISRLVSIQDRIVEHAMSKSQTNSLDLDRFGKILRNQTDIDKLLSGIATPPKPQGKESLAARLAHQVAETPRPQTPHQTERKAPPLKFNPIESKSKQEREQQAPETSAEQESAQAQTQPEQSPEQASGQALEPSLANGSAPTTEQGQAQVETQTLAEIRTEGQAEAKTAGEEGWQPLVEGALNNPQVEVEGLGVATSPPLPTDPQSPWPWEMSPTHQVGDTDDELPERPSEPF